MESSSETSEEGQAAEGGGGGKASWRGRMRKRQDLVEREKRRKY